MPASASDSSRNDPQTPAPPRAGAPAAFAGEEVFQNVVDFESFFKRLIPMLIMLFLITWLILALIFGAIGLPLAGLLGAFASGGFCAVMTQLKKKQFAKLWGSKTLTLSTSGAAMNEAGVRFEMPWGQVERIGEASTMDPLRIGGLHLLGAAGGALAAATARRREMFLLGVGRLSVDPDAPLHVKANMKQKFAGQDLERAQTGLPLAHFDKDWENGRIGEWIRAHRPDLMS